MSDDISRVARHARRAAHFPDDTACSLCGEINQCALVEKTRPILCYACQQKTTQNGKSPVENHHIAGQNNSDSTVTLPANDHRLLSDMQQDWPASTLRNADGSPLLQAAAAVRGWLDILSLIIDRVIGWIPVFLESLDTALCGSFSPTWWQSPTFGGCLAGVPSPGGAS